jgi:uncharacterized protein (TIGR04255 family)
MSSHKRKPVKFATPPVVEVACGIAFSLPSPLKTAHIGLYWSTVVDAFQSAEDAPPLQLTVERLENEGPAAVAVEIMNMPPLRRSWLINREGTNLLQVQEDRFLFNWKRTEAQPEYPSYENVISAFRDYWAGFRKFLSTNGLGEPTVRQLEMTYFNVIKGPSTDFLIDHQRRQDADRFLPEPEAVNWRTQYLLPESMGRLHVAALSTRNVATGEKAIRLELTARGMPKDSQTGPACDGWFDLAHEWITQGFTDVTSPAMHAVWGRTA